MGQLAGGAALMAAMLLPGVAEGLTNAAREGEWLGTRDEPYTDPVTGEKTTRKIGKWEPADRRRTREMQDFELKQKAEERDYQEKAYKRDRQEKAAGDLFQMMMAQRSQNAQTQQDLIARYADAKQSDLMESLRAMLMPLQWAQEKFGHANIVEAKNAGLV